MKRLTAQRPGWALFLACLAAFAVGVLGVMAAHAQFVPPAPNRSLAPPFDCPPILSTSPVQVLAIDPQRRRIIFFNPSASATIAFCPSQITRPGVTFEGSAAVFPPPAVNACAVNGAGSITLLPMASFVLDGGTPQGPPLAMGAAWFGVASSSNVPSTVFEFE